MYQKLEPRNNEWNRKYNLVDETGIGFLMDIRQGLAFFAWKFSEEDVKYFKCEQEVFEQNFKVTGESVTHEIDPFDNPHFLRYPVEG